MSLHSPLCRSTDQEVFIKAAGRGLVHLSVPESALSRGSLILLTVTEPSSAAASQYGPLTNLIMTLNCRASVEGPGYDAF